MTSRSDETRTSLSYTLSCVDCSFEATVEGDTYDVLEVIDAHKEECADDSLRHFVEFEGRETQ